MAKKSTGKAAPARMSVPRIRALKDQRKLVVLTAYDAPSARLADAVCDIVLVGDSVGTTVQGRADTVSVTMEDMIYHTRLVADACQSALVLGDMPFMSYQRSISEALLNAGRFLKEGRAQAVKLEGGASVTSQVSAMVRAGIPVVGHIGFTPQSVNTTGVAVNRDAETLLKDAMALQEAGAFALVLEMVPASISKELTDALDIPTIGIGAGVECDGQVLVFHDILGYNPEFTPKFLKRYLNVHELATKALAEYREDVIAGRFPGPEHSYE